MSTGSGRRISIGETADGGLIGWSGESVGFRGERPATEVEIVGDEDAGDGGTLRDILAITTSGSDVDIHCKRDGGWSSRSGVVQLELVPRAARDNAGLVGSRGNVELKLPDGVAVRVPLRHPAIEIQRRIEILEEPARSGLPIESKVPPLDLETVAENIEHVGRIALLMHLHAVVVAVVVVAFHNDRAAKGALAVESPAISGICRIVRKLRAHAGLGLAIAGPFDVFDGYAAEVANLRLRIAGLDEVAWVDLDVSVEPVSPVIEGVGINRGWRNCPGKNGAHAANLGLVALLPVIGEIDGKNSGVAKPVFGDVLDVVDIDLDGAQIAPLAFVVPVGPEGDIFRAPWMTQLAGISVGPLDAESGDQSLWHTVVDAEALDLLVGNIGLGVTEGTDGSCPVESQRLPRLDVL